MTPDDQPSEPLTETLVRLLPNIHEQWQLLVAERAGRVQRLEVALNERYVIKRAPVKLGDVTIGQTEYRYRKRFHLERVHCVLQVNRVRAHAPSREFQTSPPEGAESSGIRRAPSIR